MAAIFRPSANYWAALTLLGLAAVCVGGIGWLWFWSRTDYARHVRWFVGQPVPFSHEPLLPYFGGGVVQRRHAAHLHLHDLPFPGLDERHASGAGAAEPRRRQADRLEPDQRLAGLCLFQPQHSHRQGRRLLELSRRGDEMPLSYKAKTLTMQFCLDCHRDPGPNLRPKDQIYNTEWRRTADTPSPDMLMTEYHIGGRNLTDCSICHR
jgi:hypothetical protein